MDGREMVKIGSDEYLVTWYNAKTCDGKKPMVFVSIHKHDLLNSKRWDLLLTKLMEPVAIEDLNKLVRSVL